MRKRDYIVRIHVGDLRNRLVMRVTAKNRKEAVEATKAAIEITGEVAPLTIKENNMSEKTEQAPVESVEAVEAPATEEVA